MSTTEVYERPPVAVRPGTIEMGGKTYMPDSKGRLVPIEMVKAQHLLEDETVRTVMAYAEQLSAQIARFRQHTFDDVEALLAILAQEHKDLRGGAKGNITLMSHDGLLKVTVKVADQVVFGPQLQIAKSLVDQCLNDWASDARPEIRRVIQDAFAVDKEGQVNRAALYQLLRLDIEDARWSDAMKALRDSMRVVGTKRYVNFYKRPTHESEWEAVTINAAAA